MYPAIYRDLWGDDVFVQRSAAEQAAILRIRRLKSSLSLQVAQEFDLKGRDGLSAGNLSDQAPLPRYMPLFQRRRWIP